MSETKQHATVDKQGRLVPDSPPDWALALRELSGKRVVVTIATLKRAKTNSQLGYWRGFIVPYFVEQWSRERRRPYNLPDYDREQIHDLLVKRILGYEEERGPLDEPVRKKTAKSDTVEMSQLIDGGRALALTLWNAVLPLPGEPWEVL